MENKTKVAIALLGGALLGAIVYLVATDSGNKLKNKIKSKGKSLLAEVDEIIKETKEEFETSNTKVR